MTNNTTGYKTCLTINLLFYSLTHYVQLSIRCQLKSNSNCCVRLYKDEISELRHCKICSQYMLNNWLDVETVYINSS